MLYSHWQEQHCHIYVHLRCRPGHIVDTDGYRYTVAAKSSITSTLLDDFNLLVKFAEVARMGITIFKFSFGEVYHRIYGQK